MYITNIIEVSLKELVVKTIFFSSPEENNLESFIDEFIEICTKYDLDFKVICNLFEKINLMLAYDQDIDFSDI